MKTLVSFRPGVIGNNTAFEAQALIYKYLQEHYGYTVTIVKSEADKYDDPAFKIISLPKQAWQGKLHKLKLPKLRWNNQYLKPIFAEASGILTVDPTIYRQGLLAIKQAQELHKPVWFDASRTVIGTSLNFGWKFQRRFFLRKALYQTTGIIVTVPKCLERFQDIGLFDEAIAPKFTIMGHPVDTTKFTPQPKKSEQDGIVRVLVISRMIPEKGLFYILEAMTPLLRSHSNLQLQFLGSGPMRTLLEAEVVERNLSEKVIFLNSVPHQQIPSILGVANIFVNHAVSIASWEEYFGAVNLEAMSCGLPCVLTNCGGISYAIREQNVAIFVEERNIIQLRQAIAQLLNSEPERLAIGQKARDYVESYYALPLIAQKYHQMLQSGFAKDRL